MSQVCKDNYSIIFRYIYLFNLSEKTDKLKCVTIFIKENRKDLNFCPDCGNYTDNICPGNIFCYCDMPMLI
jgi:hypothetical protein